MGLQGLALVEVLPLLHSQKVLGVGLTSMGSGSSHSQSRWPQGQSRTSHGPEAAHRSTDLRALLAPLSLPWGVGAPVSSSAQDGCFLPLCQS